MRKLAPWIVRAMAVYLALGIAFLIASWAGIDEPQPSLLEALVPALALGALAQAGLFWAPSARGRAVIYAGLLMIPSGVLLSGAAAEELSFMLGGHMHAPQVAFAYLGGLRSTPGNSWRCSDNFAAMMASRPRPNERCS